MPVVISVLFIALVVTLLALAIRGTFTFDILAGLTAPIIGELVFKKQALPKNVAIAWNYLALALLLNIVTIAILSTPGPVRVFHNEPANTIIGFFPFVWLPAFVVPAAMFGHIMSLYQLSRRASARQTAM